MDLQSHAPTTENVTWLKERVRGIHERNRQRGTASWCGHSYDFTCPSHKTYPFQWFWDSCFHAIALSHIDIKKAEAELFSLLKNQHDDGFISHVTFWQRDVYEDMVSTYDIAFRTKYLSDEMQPPLLAEAVHAQDLLWLRLNWRLLLRAPRTWRHLRFRHQRHRGALHPAAGTAHAALVLRDNLRYRKSIETVYLEGITHAQETIIIANAYFLPGRKLRHALINAAQRGVKVKLLLQGKIEYRMQYHATRWIYDQFLRAGIE
ncbi:MAG: hypothetical protein RJB28_807, partial [Actinomycetota bacterium]